MKFYSTNNQKLRVSLPQAVFKGLSQDGGLFMSEKIPKISTGLFKKSARLSFQEISFEALYPYFKDDIPKPILEQIINNAFNFAIPLVKVDENIYVLELFHGPTLAFKDFGARFMARAMSYLIRNSDDEITILVATSGDTGSAVANGFLGVDGINVVILYPSGKVSEIQEKQLTTMGKNITALEIKGVFDDCQKLAKAAFVDKEISHHMQLTSANSINIARLLPQSCYYMYAYTQLIKDQLLRTNQSDVVISVPSGNFGNLTAGLIAKKMGLPVSIFVAATNMNDSVPRYLEHGAFEPHASIQTISNAMDVGNPSNFARILDLYHHNIEDIRKDIYGISFSDAQTKQAIVDVYKKYGHILDPHGAVGYLGLKNYLEINSSNSNMRKGPPPRKATAGQCPPPRKASADAKASSSAKATADRLADKTAGKGIFLQTAHPAKFLDIVEPLIDKKIIIPQRLKKCLKKQKQSIVLSSLFEELKSFLLS